MPRPKTPKVKKWGELEEDTLYNLVRKGVIDIDDTTLANIERIRQAHFEGRSSENFRRNFRNYVARLDLEESYRGARR